MDNIIDSENSERHASSPENDALVEAILQELQSNFLSREDFEVDVVLSPLTGKRIGIDIIGPYSRARVWENLGKWTVVKRFPKEDIIKGTLLTNDLTPVITALLPSSNEEKEWDQLRTGYRVLFKKEHRFVIKFETRNDQSLEVVSNDLGDLIYYQSDFLNFVEHSKLEHSSLLADFDLKVEEFCINFAKDYGDVWEELVRGINE